MTYPSAWNPNVPSLIANMPFKSKAQSRACFASKGFDGSVDCMKWAKSTQYKKLPARVKKPKKK